MSSGWFDCTEPSLSTSLQACLCTCSGWFKHIKAKPTTEPKVCRPGLGTVYTWHGTPDLRVRGEGVEFVCRNVEEGEDKVAALESSVESGDEAESVSSDGRTTTFEGKITFNDANLRQAIATCVTSSFTENTCHPNKPPIVPTILIRMACVFRAVPCPSPSRSPSPSP